jgi:hypothetical protein
LLAQRKKAGCAAGGAGAAATRAGGVEAPAQQPRLQGAEAAAARGEASGAVEVDAGRGADSPGDDRPAAPVRQAPGRFPQLQVLDAEPPPGDESRAAQETPAAARPTRQAPQAPRPEAARRHDQVCPSSVPLNGPRLTSSTPLPSLLPSLSFSLSASRGAQAR